MFGVGDDPFPIKCPLLLMIDPHTLIVVLSTGPAGYTATAAGPGAWCCEPTTAPQ